MLNIAALFDEFLPEPPATAAEIAALVARLSHPLPHAYLAFLSVSNGGWGRSGEREFGFFGTKDVGWYFQEYEFVEYMPGAVPYGLNDGGAFYVFDLRTPEVNTESPVFTCDAGANFWDTAHLLAPSFTAACQQRQA